MDWGVSFLKEISLCKRLLAYISVPTGRPQTKLLNGFPVAFASDNILSFYWFR
jgi:hypothetical protein